MTLSIKINKKLLNMLDLFTEPICIADFVECGSVVFPYYNYFY